MAHGAYQKQTREKRHRCIWEQAGVVKRKECELGYECDRCRFDKALQRAAEGAVSRRGGGRGPGAKRRRVASWKECLRDLPQARRPCIHHMKGRISFRACANDYQCKTCEFDQFFVDQHAAFAFVTPVGFMESHGISIPQGYYLHQGHLWVKVEEGGSVRIGLDDFASRLLGPLDRIEAPLLGKRMEQDLPGVMLKRGEDVARALSPISGIVTSINPRVRDHGTTAGGDTYAGEWIATLQADSLRSELKNLMIHRESIAFMDSEVERLYAVMEEAAGPLSTDGGTLGLDLLGGMPQLGWDRLTREFLRI